MTLGHYSLSAGNNANKFDAIALRQRSFHPFVLVQSEAVVLDQNGLRRQLIAFDELRDGLSATRIDGFTIE